MMSDDEVKFIRIGWFEGDAVPEGPGEPVVSTLPVVGRVYQIREAATGKVVDVFNPRTKFGGPLQVPCKSAIMPHESTALRT